MSKENFLSDFREIILLQNYNAARDALLVWLQKKVQYKSKLERDLSAAQELGMDNNRHDKEIGKLNWQIANETQSIELIVAMMEASETALVVFRDKMLETLEMDVKAVELSKRMAKQVEAYKQEMILSMRETVEAMEERNKLLFKLNGL
jgi:hypothetical protein